MKAAILYSEKIKEYDLGHVLTKERYDNFMDLFEQELAKRALDGQPLICDKSL